ncbi:hypothetical protein BT96DRAFT_881494 [Gymnopus androsaceus JB14]|uniref:Uncharacterized protein n=1 Tax=Gymnopus androsaceus JB14 TaxID=1447944 RepID=A0A6A4HMN2_9AGAR|nr:hypothetical protein BT96DRAFT_881494 [Gymnopus androsaceus JB14]
MLLDIKELPPTPPPPDVKRDTPVIRIQDDAPPPSYDIMWGNHHRQQYAGIRDLNHSRSHSQTESSIYSLTVDSSQRSGLSLDLPTVSANASTSSLYVAPVFTPKKRGWFGGKSRTIKEVREWTLNQINDLFVNRDADLDECRSVLSGCYDAFQANNLTFSTFLQEPLSEQHTFFYWSIVNRSGESTRLPHFLSALLSFGSPLTEETRADIRHACLLTNDQPLFQSLRCHRKFMQLPTAHEMIFGERIPIDDITVEDMPSAQPAFLVKMDIALFIKRMNFEKEVTLEFIAQRRAWRLVFSAAPTNKHNSWTLTLTLLEHSDPTPFDSRFTVEDASPTSDGSNLASKPKPPATIRLKTSSMLASPKKDKITVSLEDGSLIGSGLRSPSNSYVARDGTLQARLEARLTKPDSDDCVIC